MTGGEDDMREAPVGYAAVGQDCPKCGSSDIYTRFHLGKGYVNGCQVSIANRFNSADGEHLHHFCRGCGFDFISPARRDYG